MLIPDGAATISIKMHDVICPQSMTLKSSMWSTEQPALPHQFDPCCECLPESTVVFVQGHQTII